MSKELGNNNMSTNENYYLSMLDVHECKKYSCCSLCLILVYPSSLTFLSIA